MNIKVEHTATINNQHSRRVAEITLDRVPCDAEDPTFARIVTTMAVALRRSIEDEPAAPCEQ